MEFILPATITVSFFYLGLGVFVLRSKEKGQPHYLLSASAAMLFIWTFLAYFAYAAPDRSRLLVFYHLSTVGMFFYFPFNHYFVFSLTRPYLPLRSQAYPRLLFIPFAVLFAREFALGVAMAGFEPLAFGWRFVPAIGTPWNLAWVLMATFSAIASCFYMGIASFRTNLNRERRQYRLLLAALLATLALTLGEYLFISRLLPAWTVILSPILQSPWIVAMVVAIERYRFMNLLPETVSREIVQNADEAILLVNTDGHIVYANPSASDFAYNLRASGELTTLSDFGIPPEMTQILQSTESLPTRASPKRNGFCADHSISRAVIVGSRVHRIRYRMICDHFEDPLGILVMSAPLHSLDEIRRHYRLTDREHEVMELLVTGWTNAHIADSLGITERTVKAHITSIYSKLHASNKVELLNIVTVGELG